MPNTAAPVRRRPSAPAARYPEMPCPECGAPGAYIGGWYVCPERDCPRTAPLNAHRWTQTPAATPTET